MNDAYVEAVYDLLEDGDCEDCDDNNNNDESNEVEMPDRSDLETDFLNKWWYNGPYEAYGWYVTPAQVPDWLDMMQFEYDLSVEDLDPYLCYSCSGDYYYYDLEYAYIEAVYDHLEAMV